jgi:hypothetical protein
MEPKLKAPRAKPGRGAADKQDEDTHGQDAQSVFMRWRLRAYGDQDQAAVGLVTISVGKPRQPTKGKALWEAVKNAAPHAITRRS